MGIRIEIQVEFSSEAQSLGPLQEAAYRIIDAASCEIAASTEHYYCRLTAKPECQLGEAEIRSRFVDLVTDENLREKIAKQTSSTRDLIMALAFGGLADRKAEEQRAV